MPRLAAPITVKLSDEDAERVRRSTHDSIRELQLLPASAIHVIEGVVLADLVITPIKHPLGRKPVIIIPGTVRNAATAGLIQEYDSPDPASFIQLRAISFGATITVNVLVL